MEFNSADGVVLDGKSMVVDANVSNTKSDMTLTKACVIKRTLFGTNFLLVLFAPLDGRFA